MVYKVISNCCTNVNHVLVTNELNLSTCPQENSRLYLNFKKKGEGDKDASLT